MPIRLHCDCGKSLLVKDELAGRKVRCAACKTVLDVPKAAADGELDDQAVQMLLIEDEPKTRQPGSAELQQAIQKQPPKPAAKPTPSPWRESMQAEIPSPAARPAPWASDSPPRPRREKSASRTRERHGYRGLAVSRTIITGVLMMLGAVVWFGIGLMGGVIFFYPPILFVLGLIATIKGFMGYEDE